MRGVGTPPGHGWAGCCLAGAATHLPLAGVAAHDAHVVAKHPDAPAGPGPGRGAPRPAVPPNSLARVQWHRQGLIGVPDACEQAAGQPPRPRPTSGSTPPRRPPQSARRPYAPARFRSLQPQGGAGARVAGDRKRDVGWAVRQCATGPLAALPAMAPTGDDLALRLPLRVDHQRQPLAAAGMGQAGVCACVCVCFLGGGRPVGSGHGIS